MTFFFTTQMTFFFTTKIATLKTFFSRPKFAPETLSFTNARERRKWPPMLGAASNGWANE